MSAIDANKEKSILKNLNEWMEGKTVILVSHRISTLANTDHIIVLKDGKIIEKGNHKYLLQENGLYAEMYAKQQHNK